LGDKLLLAFDYVINLLVFVKKLLLLFFCWFFIHSNVPIVFAAVSIILAYAFYFFDLFLLLWTLLKSFGP
jgi:hypothetical protein